MPLAIDEFLTHRKDEQDLLVKFRFVDEGVLFYAPPAGTAGTIPLKRYRLPDSNHAFSPVSVKDGVFEADTCAVFTQAADGRVPLYQLRHELSNLFRYSTDPVAMNALALKFGYKVEGKNGGIVGYVYPGEAPGRLPVRRYRLGINGDCGKIKLKVKVIKSPTPLPDGTSRIPIAFDAMRQVFRAAGIQLPATLSVEVLPVQIDNRFPIVEVNGKIGARQPQAVIDLINISNFASTEKILEGEIAVYIVNKIKDSSDSKAGGVGLPDYGAAIINASLMDIKWAMAHEVGHVLGLRHYIQPPKEAVTRLMTSGGVGNLSVDQTPELVETEIATMHRAKKFVTAI